MIGLLSLSSLCALVAGPHLAVGYPTNLPPPTITGVFTAQASSVINAPIEEVWQVLLDFPGYPNWNPFARSMVVTDMNKNPLPDQTAVVGRQLNIQAQIPPLKMPVNADSKGNLLSSQNSFENITAIDNVNYRCAWRAIMLPNILLDAERWSALSVVETPDGPRTLYESREVYGSLVSLVVGLTMASNVQKGFTAQAQALQALMESR